MVEVALTGAAEEEGAVEAELGDGALELLRGCGRRGGGESGEALEPVRVGVHELGDAVVRLDLQAGGLVGQKVVQAGRGERDHLDVQPRLVHRRDPALSDLAEPLPHLPRRGAGPRVIARAGVEPAPRRDDLLGDKVLLGADRLHLGAYLLSLPRSLLHLPGERVAKPYERRYRRGYAIVHRARHEPLAPAIAARDPAGCCRAEGFRSEEHTAQ